MADAAAARPLAVRIARFGLADDNSPPLHPDEPDWRSGLATLFDQRLTGLAVAAAQAGHLQLSERQGEQLLGSHCAAMAWSLALERALLTAVAAFADIGVETVVLKGPAFAHVFYPNPALRAFGDLDLLVRTPDWRRAGEQLTALGFRRLQPEPHQGFDERFGKAADYQTADGITIDLHRTLVVGPFGLWLRPDELFDRTAPLILGGQPLRRLDDTTALLHACLHASLGLWPPRLLPLRDVAQIATAGKVDWEAFADCAQRWRLTAVVQHAFALVGDVLDVAPPGAAGPVLTAAPARRERRALDSYTSARRDRGGTALATLLAIPGLRPKGAYLRALLVPDRQFVAARAGVGRGAYLRRWLVPLRWLQLRRR